MKSICGNVILSNRSVSLAEGDIRRVSNLFWEIEASWSRTLIKKRKDVVLFLLTSVCYIQFRYRALVIPLLSISGGLGYIRFVDWAKNKETI